jgi:hypothetical protein
MLCGALGGAYLLFRALTNVPTVRAQSPCTNASFQGPYGYTFHGNATTGTLFGPYASAGRLVADGSGRFTGAESASINGEIVRRVYNGIYLVTPNCTGSALLNDNFGAVNNFDFVIVNGGKRIDFIQTDLGSVLTGEFNAQ